MITIEYRQTIYIKNFAFEWGIYLINLYLITSDEDSSFDIFTYWHYKIKSN